MAASTENVIREFCAERAEYITAINNCHPDNEQDYWRWQGGAEARRQLSERLVSAEQRVPTTVAMVREFHEAFDGAIDAVDTYELRALRATLIAEEQREVCDALTDAEWEEGAPVRPAYSREDIAKELADLVYVAYGTAVSLGIDLDEALRRVHASNMSKRGPDGSVAYREDGKVLKPATYQPPDMTGVARIDHTYAAHLAPGGKRY